MAVTGFTGVWPAAFGNLADPGASALRVVAVSGGEASQSGFILLSASASGVAGSNVMTAINNGGLYGVGMYQINVQSNSATAALQVSMNGADWWTLTATAMGVNTTGTGQWSGYYPYIRGGVVWASAAAGGTGTVTINLALM